ncbi:hypothetical protein BYT27DRAFT_7168910 [Phlegmacium glaucopus]|nr:hypothetical protein BYT27DRAFT_7168910 [Phlegmacium glaucopus]
MPIKSGRYFIINVQTKNQAFLPNPNSAEPVQSRYKQDDPGEQWNIIDRKNGHHGIVNVRHKQYAASGNRAVAGEQVIGWERDQTWLIQKTRVKGQYTISTTDSKRFWGLTDVEQGTPIALADVYTDPRNWWMFKDVETGNDAEVEPALDNGRTAYDTVTGEMAIRAVLFELSLPPISPQKPLELDLFILQEMPNEFIQNATETGDKICRPLIKSGQLSTSNLEIDVIEFETFEKVSRWRPFGKQTFDGLRNLRGVDFPWMRCGDYVIPFSLRKRDFRSSATKVVVMNLRSIPLRNGGKALWGLITQMVDEEVILIPTLSEPHLPDTLVKSPSKKSGTHQLISFV